MQHHYEDIIPDLFILPDYDNAEVFITFTTPEKLTQFKWKITSQEGKIVKSGSLKNLSGKTKFNLKINNFIPWSVECPFLYFLSLTFNLKGKPVAVKQQFGMRKFHIDGKQIYLNNKPFYVRGFIRGREAHDHPNLLNLSLTEYYEKNIKAAKAFGFNFVRFHSKVPPREYFDAADRLGFLTHVEIRKYFGKYQKEREILDHEPHLVPPAQWKSTIKRLRNFTSLMAYCLGNEINSPGRRPEVKRREKELRKLDHTRLFLDTCARGEFDRTGIDFDVQHMGYFASFGPHYNMFDITSNWAIFGSVKNRKMICEINGAKLQREITPRVPVVAHEVGHYVALRDIDGLENTFNKYKIEKPWWLDELKKLRNKKGLKKDYKKMLEAAQHFQFIWHKQVLESIRKSPVLCGFHFLQLSDTDRYENSNGLVDCFDNFKKGINQKDYLQFNSDIVIIADMPKRSFFENETLSIPVWLSNCSDRIYKTANLKWSLKGKSVDLSCTMKELDLQPGLSKLVTLEIEIPEMKSAEEVQLNIGLKAGKKVISNNLWKLWLFPNKPEKIKKLKANINLDEINISARYPQIVSSPKNEKLLITNKFTDKVFQQLNRGNDVLMLYRVPETRDRKAKKEKYYMPATWDRFKPVIWDRGHNLGGFLRKHPAIKDFPDSELIDFQFHKLIDDCDKFSLDGFPVDVDPIIQGVDKTCRDRFDVYTFKLSEFQPDWTMRKFAYLFDLKVGKGRLMMCAFNFSGLEKNEPEVCSMFESIFNCAVSKSWKPKSEISPDKLKKFLAEKSKHPRIKERMMTQYWQLNDKPLETDNYWKEAEEWIRKK